MAGLIEFSRRVHIPFSILLLMALPPIATGRAGAADVDKQLVAHASSAPASSTAPAGHKIVPHGKQAAAPAGRDVVFTTDDNLVIAGTYWPPERKSEPAPIVILVHGYKGSRSDFAPLVPALLKAGFAVLAIDLRGHGGSVGAPAMKLADQVVQRDNKLFASMYRDVTAAYEWLRGQSEVDLARFALVGASVGCSVALDYAGRDRSVDAVVCLTPGTSYLGLDAMSFLRKYGDRLLLLVASHAERAAADQLQHEVPKAVVHVVPGPPAGEDEMALHGTRMLGKAPGIEEKTADFLKRAVGPFSRERVVASIKGKVYYEPGSSQARGLDADNLRWFSSPAEAESRGLRAPAGGGRSKSRRNEGRPPANGKADRFPDGK